jgi:hypothetical protein
MGIRPHTDITDRTAGALPREQSTLRKGCIGEPTEWPMRRKEPIMSEAVTTTNHDKIRKWVEKRDGRPAAVRTKGEGGILRIDFGDKDEALDPIEWDEFFRIFDENKLAFLHQDKADGGKTSRFNKFVAREH